MISDTHVPKKARVIPQPALDAFRGADLILHAGDLVVPEVIAELQRVAPVVAVAGNNDPPDLAEQLGLVRTVELEGFRIGLTHGHIGVGNSTVGRALSHFPGADCVIFGHSHIAYQQRHGATLAFNPGSATDRRRSPSCSFGMLYLEPSGIRAEIHEL